MITGLRIIAAQLKAYLKMYSGSSSTTSTSPNRSMALILDCTREARFALYLNLSTKACSTTFLWTPALLPKVQLQQRKASKVLKSWLVFQIDSPPPKQDQASKGVKYRGPMDYLWGSMMASGENFIRSSKVCRLVSWILNAVKACYQHHLLQISLSIRIYFYLHVFLLPFLAFSRLLCIPVPFCSRLLKDVVVPTVCSDFVVVEVEHVCTGRIQEVPRMTNDQQSLRPLQEVVLYQGNVLFWYRSRKHWYCNEWLFVIGACIAFALTEDSASFKDGRLASSQRTAWRSRWLVGSSKRSRSGSTNKALARATLIRQPPDSFFVAPCCKSIAPTC